MGYWGTRCMDQGRKENQGKVVECKPEYNQEGKEKGGVRGGGEGYQDKTSMIGGGKKLLGEDEEKGGGKKKKNRVIGPR